jgi:hypothetical protein
MQPGPPTLWDLCLPSTSNFTSKEIVSIALKETHYIQVSNVLQKMK